MAKFPIEYSQRVPQGLPATTTSVDLAGPFRAMAEAGGALAQIGAKAKEAADNAEYSEMKMKSEMRWNAGYVEMQKEFDADKRREIYNKTIEDIRAISGKSKQANAQYALHLNDRMPQFDEWFNALDFKQTLRVAKAQRETVGQYNLENGLIDDYRRNLDDMLRDSLITPIEHQWLNKYAKTDSYLAQARKVVDSDPLFAIELLKNMPTDKDSATNEHLDEKEKLIRFANSIANQKNSASEAARFETVADYQKRIVSGQTDITEMIQEIQKASDPRMTDEDRVKAVDDVSLFFRNWGSTLRRPEISSNAAITAMENAVNSLSNGQINKQQYYNLFAEYRPNLNNADEERYLREATASVNKFTQSRIQLLNTRAEAQMRTVTDATMEGLRLAYSSGQIDDLVFNATALKAQAENIAYADYLNEVFELKSKLEDIPDDKFYAAMKRTAQTHIARARDWYGLIKENDELNKQYTHLENQIGPMIDKAFPQIKDAWKNLDSDEKSRIIELVSEGKTIEDILTMVQRQGGL